MNAQAPVMNSWRLDQAPTVAGDDKPLWGANAIARFLGVSVDTVYRMADEPKTPIYKPSGRYFAYRAELRRWLRTKP